jgi:hypothetical protein
MFRSAVRAFLTVLFLASAVSAEIVDPVFVRGTKNLANGWFEHLTAFESASDMVKYQNSFWTQPMANPNYDKSAFFDGTNYYWIDVKDEDLDLFYLHNYGPDLNNLLNDSGADTQVFHRSGSGNAEEASAGPGIWFADSEGGIYSYFLREEETGYPGTDMLYKQYFRRYASIADVLADNGTTSAPDFDGYNWEDRFFAVNGKFYRTNTGNGSLLGVAAYNSFDDLVAKRQSESYGGGVGSAYDLFMVVPRAALGLTGSPSPVPEIDPAGMGSILALLGGSLGLLERRRKRA